MWVQFTSPWSLYHQWIHCISVSPIHSNQWIHSKFSEITFVIGTHFVILQSNNSWVWIFKHFQRTNTRFFQKQNWHGTHNSGFFLWSILWFLWKSWLLVKIDSLIFSKPSLPPTHQGSMYVWALALKKDGFLLLLTASLMGFDLQTKPITQ